MVAASYSIGTATMPKGNPVDISSGVKWCAACKQNKPLSEFGKSSRTVHGYWTYCKACAYKHHSKWRKKNLTRAAVHARQWRRNNPDRAKDHDLKRNMGLPLGTYATMLQAQNGCCAICGCDKPKGKGRFHVDHCHDTGKIRGLLCSNCNLAIGHFRHSLATLVSAINYLSRTSS